MAVYTVNHAYRALRDGAVFGPYEPGTTVDLDPADAEWVNRDSPGCLTGVDAAPAVTETVEPEQAPASETRPARGGRNRRA